MAVLVPTTLSLSHSRSYSLAVTRGDSCSEAFAGRENGSEPSLPANTLCQVSPGPVPHRCLPAILPGMVLGLAPLLPTGGYPELERGREACCHCCREPTWPAGRQVTHHLFAPAPSPLSLGVQPQETQGGPWLCSQTLIPPRKCLRGGRRRRQQGKGIWELGRRVVAGGRMGHCSCLCTSRGD